MMKRIKFADGHGWRRWGWRRWVLALGSMIWLSACTNDPFYDGTKRIDYQRADYERFIAEGDKRIAANKYDHVAFAKRGMGYSGIGEYEKGIADLTQAIALFPYEGDYYGNRGYDYYKIRDYQHAIEDSSKAIAMKPGTVSWYLNRANAYVDRSHCDAFSKSDADCQAAIADYRHALRLSPDLLWVRRMLDGLGA